MGWAGIGQKVPVHVRGRTPPLYMALVYILNLLIKHSAEIALSVGMGPEFQGAIKNKQSP